MLSRGSTVLSLASGATAHSGRTAESAPLSAATGIAASAAGASVRAAQDDAPNSVGGGAAPFYAALLDRQIEKEGDDFLLHAFPSGDPLAARLTSMRGVLASVQGAALGVTGQPATLLRLTESDERRIADSEARGLKAAVRELPDYGAALVLCVSGALEDATVLRLGEELERVLRLLALLAPLQVRRPLHAGGGRVGGGAPRRAALANTAGELDATLALFAQNVACGSDEGARVLLTLGAVAAFTAPPETRLALSDALTRLELRSAASELQAKAAANEAHVCAVGSALFLRGALICSHLAARELEDVVALCRLHRLLSGARGAPLQLLRVPVQIRSGDAAGLGEEHVLSAVAVGPLTLCLLLFVLPGSRAESQIDAHRLRDLQEAAQTLLQGPLLGAVEEDMASLRGLCADVGALVQAPPPERAASTAARASPSPARPQRARDDYAPVSKSAVVAAEAQRSCFSLTDGPHNVLLAFLTPAPTPGLLVASWGWAVPPPRAPEVEALARALHVAFCEAVQRIHGVFAAQHRAGAAASAGGVASAAAAAAAEGEAREFQADESRARAFQRHPSEQGLGRALEMALRVRSTSQDGRKQLDYWVAGRQRGDGRESFVCFHASAPQYAVNVAFDLAMTFA